MAYCTQSDLTEQMSTDELVQLTDDTGAGAVDISVAVRAIADADAEIDGYCATRYAVPFATVPALIRKVSVEIAIYNLYARRQGAPEDRRRRYEDAVRWLKDVARGVVALGADAPAEASDGGPETTVAKRDRIFSLGRASDGSSGSLDNY